jgi:hypothetical protein
MFRTINYHRERVVGRRSEPEPDAHVDKGHDDSAQFDHTLNVVEHISDRGNTVVTLDLLNFKNIDPVFFLAKRKSLSFDCRPWRFALFRSPFNLIPSSKIEVILKS